MPKNYLSQDLPPAMRREASEQPRSNFPNTRPSVAKIFESFGATNKAEVANLGPEILRQIREAIDFVEKNPDIPDKDISDYLKNRAKVNSSIAEVIDTDGRAGLEEFKRDLPEQRVN